jgi:hypothetical protein
MNMRNGLGTSLGIALALAALVTTQAGAESRRHVRPSDPLLGPQPFTLSGPCSSCFGGEIRIDGVSYRLSPDARIYEAGRGFLPAGSSLTGRVVSISGLRLGTTLVACSVLVRPAPDPAASTPAGGPVSVQEGPRPQ